MRVKSKFLASSIIEGKSVAFFSAPHDEPDFIWVDAYGLARAFGPRGLARSLVKMSQNFDRENRASETAAHNGKIRTIISHPMARGLCSVFDSRNGYVSDDDDEWGGGPCETAYIKAMSEIQKEFAPLTLDQMVSSFHNQGGPGMSGVRSE